MEKILAADVKAFTQWLMGVLFAAYAWNASPVDGTDIVRSFAAKAKTFMFPFDLPETIQRLRIPTEGEETLAHVETTYPWWNKQTTLLKLLNEERRERHRAMKNDGRNTQQLQVGDIVVVKKQVISKEDKPAKLQLKTRGPYKILEKIRNSYRIQRIPTIEGMNRKPGKITTEAAHRLTKLPSTIVIHKRMDTIDTKMLARRAELCDTPLEKALNLENTM